MRVMDVLFAFPVMLLAIGIVAVLGPHTYSAAAAIAVVYTPIFARLLRGPALVLCESDYVTGARAIGASDARIIFMHVLPNLASVVLVQTSLLLSAAILVEASLSFLGLGTQPPTPSLGLMLSEGRNFLLLSPWSAIFAGFAHPLPVVRLQPARRRLARYARPAPAGAIVNLQAGHVPPMWRLWLLSRSDHTSRPSPISSKMRRWTSRDAAFFADAFCGKRGIARRWPRMMGMPSASCS